MTTSASEIQTARATDVRVSGDELTVHLADGRTIVAPITWFPRLVHGSARERSTWRLIGGGAGVHWPGLDEDISVEGLLAGRRSGESQVSLARWLAARSAGTGRGRPKSALRRRGG